MTPSPQQPNIQDQSQAPKWMLDTHEVIKESQGWVIIFGSLLHP